MDRLERALQALEGLSVGDAFGEQFFVNRHLMDGRNLPPPLWSFTDDTQMALSVVSVLRQAGTINQSALAHSFARHYTPWRGYGAAMHGVLMRIRAGETWEQVARGLFNGQGSFGNGAAMRVASLGTYFADDLEAVVAEAWRSAEVTHAHPEAIAGAIAVAVAAAYAWQLRGSPPPGRATFIEHILPHVPVSEVQDKLRLARDLAPDTVVQHAAAMLGNGSQISAQDTVPFVLWCAGESLDNFVEAMWLTVSAWGDMDTTCAMVGGIVASYTGSAGIPATWLEAREPLPDWYLQDRDIA